MDPQTPLIDEDLWVIWNGFFGILDTVSVGRVDSHLAGRPAWLDEPYDMVGPFSLDELEHQQHIRFAECQVMSRERWRLHQVDLRRQAHDARRRAQQQQTNRRQRQTHPFQDFSEKQHRQQLNLPDSGRLSPADIKGAFRKLAQKAHPDLGGNHEQFVRLTKARDALLANRTTHA